jgi:hypothetical protein
MNIGFGCRFIVSAILVSSTITCLAPWAQAQEGNTFREPPRGAGTETGDGRVGEDNRVYEGVQLAGQVGVGYGFAAGGRVGYAFHSGVYAGGAITYYTANATFVGGELGYKFFVTRRWELQPYAFLGPAFIREGNHGFGRDSSVTVLGFQPGFLGAYHFGPAFVSAEMRVYVAPSPGALAFLGGIGFAL